MNIKSSNYGEFIEIVRKLKEIESYEKVIEENKLHIETIKENILFNQKHHDVLTNGGLYLEGYIFNKITRATVYPWDISVKQHTPPVNINEMNGDENGYFKT